MTIDPVSNTMASRFRIVPKRDFGSGPGFWIDGRFVKRGFVVTDESGFTNVMPGATWFRTVADAFTAIAILIAVEGNADRFWQVWHDRRAS